jgi:hypothetical protein
LDHLPGSSIAKELTVQITVLAQLYPGHKIEQGHVSVPQAKISLALQWVNDLRAKAAYPTIREAHRPCQHPRNVVPHVAQEIVRFVMLETLKSKCKFRSSVQARSTKEVYVFVTLNNLTPTPTSASGKGSVTWSTVLLTKNTLLKA